MMKDGRHDVLVGRSWQHLTGNEVCRARGNDEHVAVLVHVHAVNAHAFRLRDASMQRRAAVEDRLLATAHVRARCATVIGGDHEKPVLAQAAHPPLDRRMHLTDACVY